MRYTKDHKIETRKHIINVSSQRFRQDGIENVGVAALMEDAGLTVGGFYSHFKSKEDLISEAVLCAADETLCYLQKVADDGGKDGLTAILEAYLSTKHRDHPQSGCVVAALASELVNRPNKTKWALDKKLTQFIDLIAKYLPPMINDDSRKRMACSIWGLMVGTLQISRLTLDKKLSAQVLSDGIANALTLTARINRIV